MSCVFHVSFDGPAQWFPQPTVLILWRCGRLGELQQQPDLVFVPVDVWGQMFAPLGDLQKRGDFVVIQRGVKKVK